MASELAELQYLGRHAMLWGGHLDRGERLSDPKIFDWLNQGLIEKVDEYGCRGYRLTAKGRNFVIRK